MPPRAAPLIFALAFICFALSAPPAKALDLPEAMRQGGVVSQAMELGRKGDWAAAEGMVAGDTLLSDIVLWRKLRAGKGSIPEYESFRTRRGHWPGQSYLARAVYGVVPPTRPEVPLGTVAAKNWKAFRAEYKKKRYDEAERLLDQISANLGGLELPEAWADARRRLARRAARMGRTDLAYRLASKHYLTQSAGYDYSDLEWIAGWVALRKLNDPGKALPHFKNFQASVETPISLGRGGYWLGRTYAALGDTANAHLWYTQAAQYQTSFYGQLAAAEIGAPGDPALAASDLPDWRVTPAMRSEDVKLAAVLHFAGEERLSFAMFSHLGTSLQGDAAVGALGALALELGRPHYAVRLAKKAARRGVLVYPAYYPVTDLAGYATQVEPAFAMSIARQETELNPAAISPVGARGLMQLMPKTAKKVAKQIGEKYSRDRLIQDWQYNARLGQSYLAEQVLAFGGSYVLAAAAYNAGPHRAETWSARYGDPRLATVDTIDWIEQIPFRETRNYVQRVMEGLYVYRARLSGKAGPMTIRQDLARGQP